MYRVVCCACLASVWIFLAAGVAKAQANVNENLETATIYVDVVNGSNHNSGTRKHPLKNISASIGIAEGNNHNGIGTKVIINPGLYRENITLRGNGYDTNLPETFEAATSGTVFISGADQYTNWTQTSNPSVYSTPWTYNFGLCPPLLGQAPPETDINLRREMAFINGTPLTQVLSMSEMLEGTFYVDDAGERFYIWPPSGTDVNSADIELADRYQLWAITNKNGVVIRGLTFEYSADCVADGAMEVDFGGSQNVLIDSDNFIWNNATGLHLFSPLTNYTVENTVANHNGAVGINAFETTSGLYQNDTADFNNWRGMEAAYYNWGAAGINIYGDAYDTESNVMTDWNAATGFHWDTNFQTINASSMYARNNLYHGMQLERNTGPMNLTQFVSCNNSNAALSAGGAPTTAGGITLRDSGGVTLTNSLMYGNGSSQLKILGSAGGIKVPDWMTGKDITVQNENFTNTGNIMEGTDPTQNVFRDPQLNGTDWLTFQSTLISGNNTWWNDANTDSYVLPVPSLYFATDFSGWQLSTLQDLNSTYSQPTGNPQSACDVNPDMPDLWLISNSSLVALDATGQASIIDTVIPLDGFSGPVSFTYDGISEVSGLSATLNPASLPDASGSTTFSITAGPSVAPGTYQVTVLANSGSTTRASTEFLVIPKAYLRFSTLSLSFPDQQAKTTSAPMTVTIYNIGQSAVNIDSIVSSSSIFADTTNCGSSLQAGNSCNINVTFTPKDAQTYSQTLTVTDGDPSSPQVIQLSGVGTAAAKLDLSQEFLGFGPQIYQTTSAPQDVTATNNGTVPVTISGVSMGGANPGDFAQTNDCGSEVDPGNSCQFNLTFTPQGLNSRAAQLVIQDNTSLGKTIMALAGVGKTAVSLSRASMGFGLVQVGSSSAAKTVTLKNAGANLTVNGFSFTGTNPGDFSQTNNCGTSVPAGGSCVISVTFTPQAKGIRSATLQISDSDPTSPQTVSLEGIGAKI